jgi:hypothetical protein
VEQNFHLDAVEAWLLQPPEEDEEEERRRKAGAKGRGVLNQVRARAAGLCGLVV